MCLLVLLTITMTMNFERGNNMTIQDMIDQMIIQGAYCIKQWHEEDNDCVVLKEGRDFECEWYHFSDIIMNTRISCMYVANNVLMIELEYD